MNITANFNSYTEMKDFARLILGICGEEVKIVEIEKPKEVKKVTKEVKNEISEEKVEPPKAENVQPKEVSTNISLETVRAKMSELLKSGKQKKVKELISSFGGEKLTDISPDRYKELLEKAEEL